MEDILKEILNELRGQTALLSKLIGQDTTTQAETVTTEEPVTTTASTMTKEEIKDLMLNYRSRGIDVGAIIKTLYGEGVRFRDLDDAQLTQLVTTVTNKYKEEK